MALFELIRTTCKKYLGKWGSRQVTMQVSTKEKTVNHKRIARVMRENGILSKRRSAKPYKNLPKTSDVIEIAENIVNRQYSFATLWPLRVFGTDITYLRMKDGKWAYLSVIKDFCTGEIVAHATSLRPDTALVLQTLDLFATHVPLVDRLGGILHSDRGSTYTSKAHCSRTRNLGLLVSMSRKGNCIDNAPTESFFGHMKDELPNTGALTFEELCKTIDEYILDHNTVRKQWHRNKMSPVDYRELLLGPRLQIPISVECLR
jgi:putative transposase